MKRFISVCLIAISVLFILSGCKDDSYPGLYVNTNVYQLLDLCRFDDNFDSHEAKMVANVLATQGFRKIDKVKEVGTGTERKIFITDNNGVKFVIIISDDQVVAAQSDKGLTCYTKSKKAKKQKK